VSEDRHKVTGQRHGAYADTSFGWCYLSRHFALASGLHAARVIGDQGKRGDVLSAVVPEHATIASPALIGRRFSPLRRSGRAGRERFSSSRRLSKEERDFTLGPRLDPQYLHSCGFQWHDHADNTAGWELVQAMRSQDGCARALAAKLFAKTENGRLLVRDLRRTRSGVRDPALTDGRCAFKNQHRGEAPMNTPYGLQVIEDCNACNLKRKPWYCALSEDVARALSHCSHRTTYPGSAILFVEGQTARGALILCSGKVKLTTTSKEGKVLIFKVVEPGEVIGLSSMISGDMYQMTAETVGPCLVNFVERDALMRLIERNGELGLRSALAVSLDFQAVCRDVHDLILARSSSEKLARLLLSSTSRDAPAGEAVRIYAPATHEEMAQRIGASRETVTRLLSSLKKRDLIKLEGSTLVIKNRAALEAMAV
jgi:CRP/FNR family transcriptional regulator, cyclic AMP receptor protein